MTTKVLIAGDARGALEALFARVGTLHASKGPFDCLLCVGDFFGTAAPDEVLKPFRSGERAPPLRTYLLGPAPAGAHKGRKRSRSKGPCAATGHFGSEI